MGQMRLMGRMSAPRRRGYRKDGRDGQNGHYGRTRTGKKALATKSTGLYIMCPWVKFNS